MGYCRLRARGRAARLGDPIETDTRLRARTRGPWRGLRARWRAAGLGLPQERAAGSHGTAAPWWRARQPVPPRPPPPRRMCASYGRTCCTR
eukprot:1645459-Pyramimonas_sp.AAC.2